MRLRRSCVELNLTIHLYPSLRTFEPHKSRDCSIQKTWDYHDFYMKLIDNVSYFRSKSSHSSDLFHVQIDFKHPYNPHNGSLGLTCDITSRMFTFGRPQSSLRITAEGGHIHYKTVLSYSQRVPKKVRWWARHARPSKFLQSSVRDRLTSR